MSLLPVLRFLLPDRGESRADVEAAPDETPVEEITLGFPITPPRLEAERGEMMGTMMAGGG